jgi:hypothetical protein
MVNAMTNPAIIPMGLDFFPANDPESTMGKIGKIQGEMISAKPSKNPSTILTKTASIRSYS